MLAYDVMPPEVIGEGFRVEQLGRACLLTSRSMG